MNLFLCFEDTYNSRLKERCMDNSLTHLNIDLVLWLEARLSGGSDRNWIYELSNTMSENLWMTCSVDARNRFRSH